MFRVDRYHSPNFEKWNSFIRTSKNATFLFHRDFMEYHKTKFEDFSLMIYKNNILIAVFPANKEKDTIVSHSGLSYGGFVYSDEISFADVNKIFYSTCDFLSKYEIKNLRIKFIPNFYHLSPSDELKYILFKCNANLYRRDLTTAIRLSNKNLVYTTNRLRNLKKARKIGVKVIETEDIEQFWSNILIPNLQQKYNKSPVHSVAEMKFLKTQFPDNIKQFNAYYNDVLIAGITIFESNQVAHMQYIATLTKFNNYYGLDAIINFLIEKYTGTIEFLDFGISTEDKGQILNETLLAWKESFGGRSLIHDFYNVDIL